MSQTTPMSTREVAQVLRTSVPTVTRRARAGDLPTIAKAPGSRGAYLFDRAAIEALAAPIVRGHVLRDSLNAELRESAS